MLSTFSIISRFFFIYIGGKHEKKNSICRKLQLISNEVELASGAQNKTHNKHDCES